MTQLPLAGSGAQVAGRFVLAYSAERQARSSGDQLLRVLDAQTGTERYRLRTRTVARAANVPRNDTVGVSLQPDGSLRTVVTHRPGNIRPVAVDDRGNVRVLGRRIRDAQQVATIAAGRRAFVSVTGRSTVRGRVRPCSGVWITSRSGRSGREVTMAGRATGRQGAPTFWDGRTAVWSIAVEAPDPARYTPSLFVRSETTLGSLRLRPDDRPRCVVRR